MRRAKSNRPPTVTNRTASAREPFPNIRCKDTPAHNTQHVQLFSLTRPRSNHQTQRGKQNVSADNFPKQTSKDIPGHPTLNTHSFGRISLTQVHPVGHQTLCTPCCLCLALRPPSPAQPSQGPARPGQAQPRTAHAQAQSQAYTQAWAEVEASIYIYIYIYF